MIRRLRSPGWRARARDAARRCDWAAAVRAYAELERVGAPRAADRVQHAHVLKESGDLAAAEAAYRRAADHHPLDVDAQRQLALFLCRVGAGREAAEVLCRALVLAPEAGDLARELDGLGVGEAAREPRLLTALLRGPPARRPAGWPSAELGARIDLLAAGRLRRAGRNEAACARFEAAAARAPWSPPVVLRAVDELSSLGAGVAAIAAARRALLRDPRRVELHLALGRALLAGGRRASARQAGLAAWRLQPGRADTRVLLGALGWAGGDLDALAAVSWAATSPAEVAARPLVAPEELEGRARIVWGYLARAAG